VAPAAANSTTMAAPQAIVMQPRRLPMKSTASVVPCPAMARNAVVLPAK